MGARVNRGAEREGYSKGRWAGAGIAELLKQRMTAERLIALSLLACAAAMLVSLPAPGAASRRRKPEPAIGGDASALVAYRNMHRAFRAARSLTFESEYVWESEGREIGRSTYRLWLKKPNHARIESRSSDGDRTGILILDGRQMWIYWPDGRPYIHASDSRANARDGMKSYLRKDASKGMHSIARETSVLGTGMSMTILDPSIFLGAPDLMDAQLESVRNAGSGMAGGEDCAIVEARYAESQRTRVFWISKRDHLPRRLEETVRVTREIVVREFWRDVVVNGAFAKDLFSWKPPADWAEYRMDALEDGLLEPGSAAPDFEATLIDGSRCRLSDFRGSIVWLTFWRLSCIPCRRELPHLQKLQDKHRPDGLVVLGFNCADDLGPAAEFLREAAITFPTVVDTSAAAQEIFYRAYQNARGQSALPLNYLIDRRGAVVVGWYGYKKGVSPGERMLRDLIAGD